MAWTATPTAVDVVPDNAEQIVVTVDVSDGTTSTTIKIGPGDATPQRVAEILKDKLDRRDTIATLRGQWATLIGQPITLKSPDPVPENLLSFRANWRRLKALLSLSSSTPATVNKITQIRSSIESDLAANPSWLDDSRIE